VEGGIEDSDLWDLSAKELFDSFDALELHLVVGGGQVAELGDGGFNFGGNQGAVAKEFAAVDYSMAHGVDVSLILREYAEHQGEDLGRSGDRGRLLKWLGGLYANFDRAWQVAPTCVSAPNGVGAGGVIKRGLQAAGTRVEGEDIHRALLGHCQSRISGMSSP
jgi:hypothetical protein